MARVLLTGFEPFGSFKRNPSWDALKLAEERGLLPMGAKLARIPVTFSGAFAAFESAAAAFKPDVAVCFGVHGSRERQTIYLERVARNRNESTADNAGVAMAGPIVVGAPEEIRSAYPIEDLRDPLVRAEFAAEFSDNAGGYLCNHLYFRACHKFKIPVAFVHVPPVEGEGLLSLERLAQAVSIVAQHAAFLGTLKRK